MKSVIFLVVFFSLAAFAQEKTIEHRSTKDSTGRIVVTDSEIISKSEDITPRSGMLIINPLKFFLFYNITFYAKINQSIAAGIGVQAPTISGLNGFGLNGEVRIYPKGKSLRGFYFAPNFSVNSLSSDNSATETITSVGMLIGWQWFPGDEFAMGLGIGVDYYSGSNSNGYSNVDGMAPALRFDIGFAW